MDAELAAAIAAGEADLHSRLMIDRIDLQRLIDLLPLPTKPGDYSNEAMASIRNAQAILGHPQTGSKAR